MKAIFDIATPYTAAYILLRKDHKLALLLRAHTETGYMDGYYGLVSGRVEKDENFLAAAAREAKEETGVTIKPENLKLVLTLHRKSPDSLWVDIFFEAVSWGGVPRNAEPEQHSELAWLDPNNLPENVIPYVSFAIEQIEAGKTYAEYGWE